MARLDGNMKLSCFFLISTIDSTIGINFIRFTRRVVATGCMIIPAVCCKELLYEYQVH